MEKLVVPLNLNSSCEIRIYSLIWINESKPGHSSTFPPATHRIAPGLFFMTKSVLRQSK